MHAAPKRAFLKRGEGLSRFTKRRSFSSKAEEPKPHVLAKVISRSNSEPAVTLRGSRNVAQRLPVQRKTTSLNKENRQRGFSSPSQQIASDRGAERTKVLGSHQRQNTDRPASVHTDQDALQNKAPHERVGLTAQSPADPEHKMLPRPVTKQGGTVKAPTRNDDEESEKSRRSTEKETQSSGAEVPEEVFELSFQEKLQRWECEQHTESMELGEFELLEKAAEEHSFSSNSSFVVKVKGFFSPNIRYTVEFCSGIILLKLYRFLWPSRVCSVHVDPADGQNEGQPRASTTTAVLHPS